MRNRHLWTATKFVRRDGGFAASRDLREVGGGSRIVGDLQAAAYADAIARHARGRLLDLGCGKAPLYGVYGDRATDIVCVDWPMSVHDSPYLDAFADVNRDLPFADASFDTVLLTDVLEHAREPERLLRELRRILRPGGSAILATPFFYWIHEAPHDYFRYTEFAFRHFAARLDFEVVDIAPYGGPLEILADLGSKLLYRPKLRLLHRAYAASVRGLLGIKAVRSFSRRQSGTFPLGYVAVFRRAGEPGAERAPNNDRMAEG